MTSRIYPLGQGQRATWVRLVSKLCHQTPQLKSPTGQPPGCICLGWVSPEPEQTTEQFRGPSSDVRSAGPGQALAATGELANNQQGQEVVSRAWGSGQTQGDDFRLLHNQSLSRSLAPLVYRGDPNITPLLQPSMGGQFPSSSGSLFTQVSFSGFSSLSSGQPCLNPQTPAGLR